MFFGMLQLEFDVSRQNGRIRWIPSIQHTIFEFHQVLAQLELEAIVEVENLHVHH